jgi:hypothetical protein
MKVFTRLNWFFARLRQILRHFAEVIRTSGAKAGFEYFRDGTRAKLVRALARGAGKYRESSEFDRKWGTDTSGRVHARNLGISHKLAIGVSAYSPTAANRFHDIIGRLKISFVDYAFVDCGSGKGLVLLLASQYPFKSIVGVELSPILHEVATLNLSKNDPHNQRCFNIELICQDVTEYQFPIEPCVVYFYNPFTEAHLFEKVLARLLRSYDACPRDIIIVYLNPVFIKCLEAARAFEQIEEVRFGDRRADWAVIFRVRRQIMSSESQPKGASPFPVP